MQAAVFNRLFMPYCTNLFLNAHLGLEKAKNTHTGSGHCYFFLAPTGWIDPYSMWCVVLWSAFPIAFFPWWTLSPWDTAGTSSGTLPHGHPLLQPSAHLFTSLITLPSFSHIDCLLNPRMIKSYSSGWVWNVWGTRTPCFQLWMLKIFLLGIFFHINKVPSLPLIICKVLRIASAL